MARKVAGTFIDKRDHFKGKNYLFCTIAYHLAPVMEKWKPAVLLSFRDSRRNLFRLWEDYKGVFPTARLDFLEIKSGLPRACVLFYSPQLLHLTLKQKETTRLLLEYGYPMHLELGEILGYLKARLNTGGCPHEIGVFLGIPAGDVQGFTINKGKNFLDYGYWKIYEDPPRARNIFKCFDEAKKRYLSFLQLGILPHDYLERYYY